MMTALRDGKEITGRRIGKVEVLCDVFGVTIIGGEYPVIETAAGDRFAVKDGEAIAFREEASEYNGNTRLYLKFYPDD